MIDAMKLYSYCLRFDDGAAPNPYWGFCTLAICKPAIRRTAKEGDWVLGIGSRNSPLGDISRNMVYAMKVTRILSIKEYDDFCRQSLPGKIPDWDSQDFRKKMGDCIYDFFSSAEPRLRRSVHAEHNRETDLSGRNVLISEHFYYFGDRPVRLPAKLSGLSHPAQGHKSDANQDYVADFLQWIEGEDWKKNTILGEPQLKNKILSMTEEECRNSCSEQDGKDDKHDEPIFACG